MCPESICPHVLPVLPHIEEKRACRGRGYKLSGRVYSYSLGTVCILSDYESINSVEVLPVHDCFS